MTPLPIGSAEACKPARSPTAQPPKRRSPLAASIWWSMSGRTTKPSIGARAAPTPTTPIWALAPYGSSQNRLEIPNATTPPLRLGTDVLDPGGALAERVRRRQLERLGQRREQRFERA